MQEVIPTDRKVFPLTANCMSANRLTRTDIVLLFQDGNDSIGLLSRHSDMWFFKDITKGNNYWSGAADMMVCINKFANPNNHIYKFDSVSEMVLYLVKKLGIHIPVDQGFKFINSKTGKFAKKPKCESEQSHTVLTRADYEDLYRSIRNNGPLSR